MQYTKSVIYTPELPGALDAMKFVVCSLLLLHAWKKAETSPVAPPTARAALSELSTVNPTKDESTELVDWLTRYGYLPPSDPSTGQLQAWTAVTQAIKAMQRFAGLNETGVVDKETLTMINTPRCSLPDEPTQQMGSEFPQKRGEPNLRQKRELSNKGTQRNIDWRLESYPASSSLSHQMVRSLVYYALRIWAEPTAIEFHEVGSNGFTDIQVDFLHGSHGDEYPFDGAGGAVGHAFFPSDPQRAGRVHLDSQEDWRFRQPASQGTDLFTVLLHEFGHALGLSHSTSRHSVMRPYYQGPVGDPLHFTLGTHDQEQIAKLYGKRDQLLATDFPGTVLQLHKKRSGHHVITKESNSIDRCTASFDVVTKIRGETFFFKDLSMWRVSNSGLVSGKAASVRQLWRGLPPSLPPLQAVLEKQSDHSIVFITETQYWVFTDITLQEGYPRPASELGFGEKEVEQGLVWDSEKGPVWGERKYKDRDGKEDGVWYDLIRKGVNGITMDVNGSIYIFKGHLYWKFPSAGSAPESGFPRFLSTDWLDCPQPSNVFPGRFSFSPQSGKQDFYDITHGQERDRVTDVEKPLRKDGKTQVDLIPDGERVQLQHWSCPCMNRGHELSHFTAITLLGVIIFFF